MCLLPHNKPTPESQGWWGAVLTVRDQALSMVQTLTIRLPRVRWSFETVRTQQLEAHRASGIPVMSAATVQQIVGILVVLRHHKTAHSTTTFGTG